MKPWNAWVACLGCAGLCLALVGCGGGSSIPDPDSDANAAQAPVPPQPSAPPVIAQAEPEPAAAPAEPAPAPAPAAAPEAMPAPAAAETPTAAPQPTEPADQPESPATNPPAAAAPKSEATPEATPPADAGTGTPGAPATATAEATPAPATADAAPAPAPAIDPSEANNPFAVFSETSTTKPASAPAPGTAAAPGVMPAEGEETGNVDTAGEQPVTETETTEDRLSYLNTAGSGDRGGESGNFHSPWGGATAFLKALEAKDVDKIAEATALRAPLEAGAGNQRLFQALLDKNLAEEDLAELAKKLEGFKISGMNTAKSTGRVGITVTKAEKNSILRRTITMRHEKAGWKVLDISGQGEIKSPIMMRGRGRKR